MGEHDLPPWAQAELKTLREDLKAAEAKVVELELRPANKFEGMVRALTGWSFDREQALRLLFIIKSSIAPEAGLEIRVEEAKNGD